MSNQDNITAIDETNIKNILIESKNDHNRNVLELHNKVSNFRANIFGTIIYIIVIIILIPLLLIKYKLYDILIVYFPNVDMIATVLGYNGGPNIFGHRNIWLYLYNPGNSTLFGFINQTMINYFALIGATGVIAYNTHKFKNWRMGWSLAFIMMITTYLAPNNILVSIQNYFADLLLNNYRGEENVKKLWKLYNKNKNHQITKSQLENTLASMGYDNKRQHSIEQLFASIDSDKNNNISFEEFEEFLKAEYFQSNYFYLIIVAIGLLTVISIILLEAYLIKNHALKFEKFIGKFIEKMV